jgi:hypothetical protein
MVWLACFYRTKSETRLEPFDKQIERQVLRERYLNSKVADLLPDH